jgi:hypothetical protein
VLIAATLLGDRGEPYYRDGMSWLLGRQRADGTFEGSSRSAKAGHGVLVCSWAFLEMLR